MILLTERFNQPLYTYLAMTERATATREEVLLTETAHNTTSTHVSDHQNAHNGNESNNRSTDDCLPCVFTMLSAVIQCELPDDAVSFDHNHDNNANSGSCRQGLPYIARDWRSPKPKRLLGFIQPSSGNRTHKFQQIYIDLLFQRGKNRVDGVDVPEAPAIDLRATTGRDKHTALQAIATICDLGCGSRNKIYVN